MISDVGVSGELSWREFESSLTRMSATCKIRLAIETVSPLELALPEELDKRLNKFGSPHVLTVVRTEGVVNPSNEFVQATYNASLWNTKDEKRVWRANIEFPIGSDADEDAATRLGRTVMNRMVKDELVAPACFQRAPVYQKPKR